MATVTDTSPKNVFAARAEEVPAQLKNEGFRGRTGWSVGGPPEGFWGRPLSRSSSSGQE
jgi:hypothetical protein